MRRDISEEYWHAHSHSHIQAIQAGYEKKETIINHRFVSDFERELRLFDDYTLNTLAELVARSVLDIKVAALKNEIGIYHDKLGILTDKDDNSIVF